MKLNIYFLVTLFLPARKYGFTLAIIRLDGSHETIRSRSNMITEEQKKLIRRLKPGDKLWVENITWGACCLSYKHYTSGMVGPDCKTT